MLHKINYLVHLLDGEKLGNNVPTAPIIIKFTTWPILGSNSVTLYLKPDFFEGVEKRNP